ENWIMNKVEANRAGAPTWGLRNTGANLPREGISQDTGSIPGKSEGHLRLNYGPKIHICGRRFSATDV
ncbi:hypothetical protein HAX54_021996, partial [Datura stramonium]|nr:hypothetical protein [Datura stramonium]